MRKLIKISCILAAVLAALMIALVILANVLITPERVRATVLPVAEKNLHRKVDLGDIKVSLLSGIEIHGLKIYDQDGIDTFVTSDLVRLRYQLLPLLAMKVVIDEVRLEKPSIRVVRLKNGQFNFSDLMNGSNSPAGKETGQPATPAGTPISLLVSQLLLQDGQLIFFDHVFNDKAPYRYELSGLQIEAQGVSLSGEVPLSMQCAINGSPLSLEGQLKLAPLGGNFEIALQNFNVVPFMPYIQDKLPGKLGGLTVNLKSTVAGTPDDVSLKGLLSLTGLDLRLDAFPEAPLENASFDADYDLQFNLGQDSLELRRLGLNYNSIQASVTGGVTGLSDKPSLDLAVTVPKLQIGQALNAVPQSLVGNLRSYDPTGSITIEANLFGSTENALGVLKSATVDLENVQANAGEQRPAFSGSLLLDGDQLVSKDLQLRLGDNNASIDFQANNIFSKPITVRADIVSKRFLLEPLLQGSAGPVVATDQGQGKAGQGKANESGSTDEIGPFDLPLQVSGSIKIAETVWKGLVINDFLAQYELKKNIFNLIQMEGKVAGGTFSNTARVDLGKKGLAYSANLGLKTIQADPLVTAFMPQAAGNLQGTMDLALFLDGRGTQWQSARRSLSGNGNMLVSNGQLNSPALINGLGSFLQLSEFNDLRFENFSGQFKIVDGKVILDSQMLSDSFKLFPKGNIGLDGTLDLALDTRLSPELSKKMDRKGGITSYLADNDGWTRLPLLLRGSVNSPVFSLDPKGVQEQASKALGSELGRQLDKFFKQPESTQQATDQPATDGKQPPAEDPARKVLQDSLQKLFGN